VKGTELRLSIQRHPAPKNSLARSRSQSADGNNGGLKTSKSPTMSSATAKKRHHLPSTADKSRAFDPTRLGPRLSSAIDSAVHQLLDIDSTEDGTPQSNGKGDSNGEGSIRSLARLSPMGAAAVEIGLRSALRKMARRELMQRKAKEALTSSSEKERQRRQEQKYHRKL